MNCLIIGGTSGLGLSLAKKLKNYDLHVTGRRKIKEPGLHFHSLDLTNKTGLDERINKLVAELPNIDLLIYAAGYFQDGTITDLSVNQVDEMLNVGLIAAIYVSRGILRKQDVLPEFVAITSTSQWTPRLKEPVYTAVKAGLGAFANSLSLDPRVGKVLVAGPAGMATNFWKGTNKKEHDTSLMMDPDWVAGAIQKLREGQFSYKFARILREPARVEVQETRD